MFRSLTLVILTISCTEVFPYQTVFWKHMIQQINNFRRIRAVDLKVADMQKIYWDDKLETIAAQKVERLIQFRVQYERSNSFWIETTEKDSVKRASEYFSTLTKDSHREDRVTEAVWNAPFNLVISADTIRMGCVEAETNYNKTSSIIMMCAFGPNQVHLHDRLYTRGTVCELCPPRTGCEDNLCDEKVPPGFPPIADIIGIRMSTKSQLTDGLALVFVVFFIICALLVQCFS